MSKGLASNAEWQQWGKQDPLFGVASWAGREKDGTNPWTDEEFYALGADWNDFNRAWLSYGPRLEGAVLEIGSGAGRMTRMLAEAFQAVIASDVSPDILKYARSRIPNPNIEWRPCNGEILPAENGSVAAVFSCHVLQHFPDTSSQLAIFKEMLRILRPGGSVFVHIPMYLAPQGNIRFEKLVRGIYHWYLKLAAVKTKIQSMRMAMGGKPPMRGIAYAMITLISDLQALGFSDVGVSIVTVGTNGTLHTCVYGKKPD